MGKRRRQPFAPTPPTAAPTTAATAIMGNAGLGRQVFGLWRPTASDANGADQFELLDQRAASRELSRTNPIAAAGVIRWAEYVIGQGLRMQSQIDVEELGWTDERAEEWQKLVERRFDMWARDKRASVEGDQSFYQMQRLGAHSAKSSGDIFAVFTVKERRNWPFRTAVQLIEADRVCNDNNGANTAQLFEGIQRSVDGEIQSIWVANHHPSSSYLPSNRTWTEIQIRDGNGRQAVAQWKTMRRPGQSRGTPLPSVITDTLKQAGRYADAELDAAVNCATDAIFAQMNPDSFDAIYSEEQKLAYVKLGLEARQAGTALQSGRIVNTLPGETITSPTPGRPNPNAAPFFHLWLEIIAMGLTMPSEILIGKFTTSYTAAQAAFQQWFQTVFIDRADAITDLCQPTYETWLFDSVVDGIIDAPGYLADPFARAAFNRATWTGSGKFVLNPLQEAKAAELRAQFLTSEAEESLAYDGGDYDTRHRLRVREAKSRRDGELPPLGTQAQAEAPDPADDPEDLEDQPGGDQPGGDPPPNMNQ